ncbi:MAG: hypothetical protein PHC61_02600 [Chitinivibrionales bacterium]|nr:hypothetical protein [Chitinivibrionales bacterium]
MVKKQKNASTPKKGAAPKTEKKAGAKKAPPKPGAQKQNIPPKADDTQIGAIMAKSLDLAEAGLTLGLNLFQKFGTSVGDQLMGKIAQAAQAGKSFVNEAAARAAHPREQASASTQAPEAADAAENAAPERSFAGVYNRLPLFPGSPVKVPFSINNDAAEAVKKVNVKLEGLTGELTDTKLDAAQFAIKPAHQSIDPMDFEKFLITGTVPPHTPSDAYNGWIIVTGDEQLKIPVKLVVTGNG